MLRTQRMIAGVAVVGLGLSLAACSAGGGEEPSDGGPATINVILNGNAIGTNLAEMVDEFNETNESGITVTTEVLAEQQMRDKQQLNLQSRSNAMDVYMTLPSREGPLFEDSGYYEPLDEYFASASESFAADDFGSASIGSMYVNDTLVAIPMNVEGPVMYYRTDLFEQAGVEVPETVEELMEVAATLEGTSDGSWVPVTLRGQADALAYTFGAFFHADGLEWTTDGVPNFDDPRAVTAIDQYATLARDFGPDGVINYSFNESTNLFAAGGAAIELESSNLLPTIVNPDTSTVIDVTGVAPMPGGEGAILSWGLAISPFSEHKDAAWEFVEWATSPEVQLEMAKLGIAPPRDSIFEDPEYQATLDTPLLQQWRDTLLFVLSNGNPEVGPVGFQAPAMRKVIGDGVGSVILGQATAEEAANAIQEQLNPLLADQQ